MSHNSPRPCQWAWRGAVPGVGWGFTSRTGGFSEGPWQGLNLGSHVSDDPSHVEANRLALANEIGAPAEVAYMSQVHGASVCQVTDDYTAPREVDAMFTTTNRPLAVLVADCVPVVMWAQGGTMVGVAHAGRPGMVAGVVVALVDAMRTAGAGELTARVGPCISPMSYEVPEQMRDDVATVEPLAASITRWGTPAVDVAAGVLAQLARLGVSCEAKPMCTYDNDSLYSYRRDGVTGRQAGVVWRTQ